MDRVVTADNRLVRGDAFTEAPCLPDKGGGDKGLADACSGRCDEKALPHPLNHTMKPPSTKRVMDASHANNWHELGGDHIWLPYTQMKTALTPLMVESTAGSCIRLADGRELIDGVASWWTACHGYNHPHILHAMQNQLHRMPHVMFGGLNHEPALRLAKRLAALTPGDLSRVFFSDSGSVAVEVALKMAVQYWRNKGERGRTKFVSFRNGYHGDTMACMAVCDPNEWVHAGFKDYLEEQFTADLPRESKSTEALNILLEREKGRIAAVILEPLVQGAGGMTFHDKATLKRLADLCAQKKVLLIADEIFTGFGRTGHLFACEEADIVPDILCLGKALTGGAVTLAATAVRPHVFEAFWSNDANSALMHGTTYMANPLACAAANASLDLFEREPRLTQVKAIEMALKESLAPYRNLPGVVDVRVKGAIGVVQLEKIENLNQLRQRFVEQGVWIRPIDNVIYLAPAFTISKDELTKLTNAIGNVLKAS